MIVSARCAVSMAVRNVSLLSRSSPSERTIKAFRPVCFSSVRQKRYKQSHTAECRLRGFFHRDGHRHLLRA
jgi:hypothetical protein